MHSTMIFARKLCYTAKPVFILTGSLTSKSFESGDSEQLIQGVIRLSLIHIDVYKRQVLINVCKLGQEGNQCCLLYTSNLVLFQAWSILLKKISNIL